MTVMKPHVAVLSSPGLGHIIPLFELSKRLAADHGFTVTFLAVTTTEPSAAQDALLHSSTLPADLHVVDLPPVNVAAVVPTGTPFLTHLSLLVQESLRSLNTVLLKLPTKPKALVIDPFCSGAFEVCKTLSIPVHIFFTPSANLLAFFFYFPTLVNEVECELIRCPGPIRVPGCSPVRVQDLMDEVGDSKSHDYKWFLFHFSRLYLGASILANTWEDLEPVPLRAIRDHPFFSQIPAPPVYPVGPIVKVGEPDSLSGNKCLAWLDMQPPGTVLLVSLGSGGTLTGAQLTELALGLETSQQRFVWVVRRPSDVSASATFFNVGSDVNDPKAYLPEGFLERTEGRGMVVPSWAPQMAVLGHPATAAFLSHCGWNSTLESMVNGVPMIAWPLYAEQKMNATALAEEVGVAVKVAAVDAGKGVVGRGEIEKVVRMVMEGAEGVVLRRRAKELKESAARALRVGGSSHDSLSRVAQEWKS